MTTLMPAARATDPETSHEAADAHDETTVTVSQAAVLHVLATYGPLADVELVERYNAVRVRYDHPPQTDSGIRSRRADLVKLGLAALQDTVVIGKTKHRRFRALARPS